MVEKKFTVYFKNREELLKELKVISALQDQTMNKTFIEALVLYLNTQKHK